MNKNKLTNRKVGVFLVGSRKSGTTSLANFLDSHPDISLSSNKEPNYFNGINSGSIDQYHSLFDWHTSIQLEASTSYTTDIEITEQTCRHIQRYNPNAKIIYVVRDPISRIQSHYRMSYERGDLNVTLNEALQTHKLLLDCSKYYSQIIKYISEFGKENVLIIKNEDLKKSSTEQNIIDFLELDKMFVKKIGNENTANADYRMPRSIDNILNNKLFKLFKSIIPQSFVANVKSRYYKRRNHKMSMDLNDDSIKTIKEELVQEMISLQKIVSFDISPWIDNLNSL